MFLIAAGMLVVSWLFFFGVAHVHVAAIHVLLLLAAVSAVVHTIRPRKSRGPAEALPEDAIK
jgi:hypothetical protein